VAGCLAARQQGGPYAFSASAGKRIDAGPEETVSCPFYAGPAGRACHMA